MYHGCFCSICKNPEPNPTKYLHRAMNYFLRQLDERLQRLYVGLEAAKRGQGSERALALITGWAEEAIVAARRALEGACQADGEQAASESYVEDLYQAKLARAVPPKPPEQPNQGYYK